MAMVIRFSLEFVFGAVFLVVAFREDGFRTSRSNAVQMFGGANNLDSLFCSSHLLFLYLSSAIEVYSVIIAPARNISGMDKPLCSVYLSVAYLIFNPNTAHCSMCVRPGLSDWF